MQCCSNALLANNLWDNINHTRAEIDFTSLVFNSGDFIVKKVEDSTTVRLKFLYPEDKTLAAIIEFNFSKEDTCNAILVSYTCEPCYHEHVQEVEESKYFHVHSPQINLMRNYEKTVQGIKRYYLEFTLI